MTFNGQAYETIIELERLIVIQEYAVKAYSQKLKMHQLAREIDQVQKTQVLLNIYTECLTELKNFEEEMLNKIDLFGKELKDIEFEIFVRLFVHNQTNDRIKGELFITDSTFDRYNKAIKEKLKASATGRQILEILKRKEG